eukprot:6172460-Pleurochrysis_carterae.AAC.6
MAAGRRGSDRRWSKVVEGGRKWSKVDTCVSANSHRFRKACASVDMAQETDRRLALDASGPSR